MQSLHNCSTPSRQFDLSKLDQADTTLNKLTGRHSCLPYMFYMLYIYISSTYFADLTHLISPTCLVDHTHYIFPHCK